MRRVLAVCVLVWLAFATSAMAAPLRFTATSAQSGLLGYLVYDSAVFDPSDSFQWVDNGFIEEILFTDPLTSFVVDTPGPAGDSTIFDSTGILPVVVGGAGFTGGVSPTGVWVAGTDYVALGGSTYADVSWVTTQDDGGGPPVPEPGSLVLLGTGVLGAVRAARRKRRG